MKAGRKTLGLLLGASAFCLLPPAFCQLRIAPPYEPPPSVTVRPVPDDEPALPATPTAAPDANANPTPAAAATIDDSNPETLKQQLKETQDRLHAFETENEALRRRNELRQNTIRTLNESLAVANAECEVFRRQYGDLKQRMEALGLASVGDNKEALQQRLLTAVNDLRLVRDEKDKLADSTMGLTESVLLYLKTATSSNPQLRMQIEAQIRAASEAVDEAAIREAVGHTPVEGNLNSGQVISVKEDFSLVVVNLGRIQGVKIGTPFIITRGDKYVAKVRVVDVREKISGAVVEEFSSNTEKVKVGDTMRADVQS